MTERKRRLGFHDEVVAQIQAKLPSDVEIAYKLQASKHQLRGVVFTNHLFLVSRRTVQLNLTVGTRTYRGQASLHFVTLQENLYSYNIESRFGSDIKDQLPTVAVELLRALDLIDKANVTFNTVVSQLCQDGHFEACAVESKGLYQSSSTSGGLSFDFGDGLTVWGDAFVVYTAVPRQPPVSWGNVNEVRTYVRFDGHEIQVSSGDTVDFKELNEYLQRYVTEARPKFIRERDMKRNMEVSSKLAGQLSLEIEGLTGVSVGYSEEPDKIRLRVDALFTPSQVRTMMTALKQAQE